MSGYDRFEDITLRCAEYLRVLQKDVEYKGDDEAKQKQQGRALFDRSKRFFQLIKVSSECGISSRRGQHVESESLCQETLCREPLKLTFGASKVRLNIYYYQKVQI